jgi:pimeloyl-ACP methyl ester carboxylesterase
LLRLGGNQSMALIIQHGALRDSESYFCSFKKLMLTQPYRPFADILVIAPDFNYATDDLVHPNDAVWNSSKPWGDWRVGAESDPHGKRDPTTRTGRANRGVRPTISSFDVLDHILALLTDKNLYPHIDKISFVGHSAGTWRVLLLFLLSPVDFSLTHALSLYGRWSNDSTVRYTQCIGGTLVYGHWTR